MEIFEINIKGNTKLMMYQINSKSRDGDALIVCLASLDNY